MGDAADLAFLDASATRAALEFPALIESLRQAFACPPAIPERHHHRLPQPDGSEAALLLMPAWYGPFLGLKTAAIFPGNAANGLPAVHSSYLLSDGGTGRPIALLDGDEITSRRTAAVSALAASFLAREEADSLLVVGAGRVGRLIADAWRTVRPLRRVWVWSRRPSRAEALAVALRDDGLDAAVAPSLEAAARAADMISCATLATEPLIRGEWLRPGAHLDLIGGFTPAMREADDACFGRGPVFVDTEAAIREAGDLIVPIARGRLAAATIGTLADLCGGRVRGRTGPDEITIFKAVGTALADIAAASLAWQSRQEGQ